MAHDTPAPNTRPTMLFDGACPVCTAEVSHYQKIDTRGAVTFANVHEAAAILAKAGISQERALARLHVIDAEGQVHVGARAFAEVWLHLPGWRWLGRIAKHPPLLWILAVGYRLVLPVRAGVVGLLRWRTARRQMP